MRLYIVRHADPDYTNDTITEDGHKEAEALSRRLADHGLDRIYCSPMGRAIATMQYTARRLKLGYDIEQWTREMWPELALENSAWGTIFAIDVPGEVYRNNENMPAHHNWYQCPALEGYSLAGAFEALKKNSDAFFKRLGYEREGGRYRCVRPNREKVAVFCHGGFGLTWLAHLLEIPPTLMWSGFWLPPSSVTTILFDERTPEWAVPRCIGMGDVSHLYEAGLPVKPRGIIANYY